MIEDADFIIELEQQLDLEPEKRKQAVRELHVQRRQNWLYLGRWKDAQPVAKHHMPPSEFGHLATDISTSSRRNWARKK